MTTLRTLWTRLLIALGLRKPADRSAVLRDGGGGEER